MLFSKIKKCRISDDKKLIRIGKLGNFSLTGTFNKTKNKLHQKTPIELVYSKKSKLLQLAHNYNESKLFGNNYGYRSSLNKSMISHLKSKKVQLIKIVKPKKNDSILDIGSNDGTLLNLYTNKYKRFGVDPTAKKFMKYYQRDIKVIPKIFKKNVFDENKKFKIITAIAMFYDLKDPLNFCKQIEKNLDKDGIFHVEVAYLPDILRLYSFDTFCQEHLTYFSFSSFDFLIKQTNLKIIDYHRNDINGGSINFDIAFKNSKYKSKKNKLQKLRITENELGVNNSTTYKKFYNDLIYKAEKINSKILEIKKKNKKIYGYGASTKGNVLLQLCKLDDKLIDGIYDINKDKFNLYTPGSNIKIISEKKIKKNQNDYIFLLIWHFKKSILKNLKKYGFKNTKYIWPFPSIKISNKL
jgi:hypothetical protein